MGETAKGTKLWNAGEEIQNLRRVNAELLAALSEVQRLSDFASTGRPINDVATTAIAKATEAASCT